MYIVLYYDARHDLRMTIKPCITINKACRQIKEMLSIGKVVHTPIILRIIP